MTVLPEKIRSLPGGQRVLRAGMATRCCWGARIVAEGGTAVLVASNRETRALARGFGTLFFPELSSCAVPLGQAVWERPLVSLPELALQSGRIPDWSGVLAALYALSQGRPSCIVTGMESLLLRHVPRDFFENASVNLHVGQEISREMLLEQAALWGYARVPMVSRPGEMALRGDIMDIYLAGYARPVRMEFFGDMVETMRLFDGETQRSLQDMEEVLLLPVSPVYGEAEVQRLARSRWEKLFREKSLGENELYSLKCQQDRGGGGILPGTFFDNVSLLEDWLPKDTVWLLPGEADVKEDVESAWRALRDTVEREDALAPQPARLTLRDPEGLLQHVTQGHSFYFESLAIGVEHEGLELPERELRSFSDLFPLPGAQDRPWQHLSAALKEWQGSKKQIILAFASERGRSRFLKLAEQEGILPFLRYMPEQHGIYALVAPCRSGADLAWDTSLVLGEDLLQPKADRTPRVSSRVFKGLDAFDDLHSGDLLVHRDYGIGRFAGLHHMPVGDVSNDYLLIEYSGTDKLYVPADRLALIQRFRGGDGAEPALDRLGGIAWSNGKEKARKAIEKIAADLVEMYAYRKVAKGFRYAPIGEMYREFEATFGFEETPDQSRTIQEVLEDMEKDEPMDRLVCGDVGFGKTEVALRAAFRAASEGRQVVMLCPTTVLAEQHFQTFRARLAGFPVNVGLLSRFVSRQKQQETLKAAAQGQMDILIGTHRLLSQDVKLPNLALLILDEEQRFGVRHKERLKALKKNVDVLTLTATPIPRTLQLSISGIRDLSVIETAPQERKPVATALLRRDAAHLKTILEREIARNGQVFWVYNRVQGIERVVEYVRSLVPDVRVAVAHGQMAEGALEEAMRKFWHAELDVLVCTSIVESGLDFPGANTLVVDQAQMFGLGQLYQLRGRVGRSDRQAYAVFIVSDAARLSEIA